MVRSSRPDRRKQVNQDGDPELLKASMASVRNWVTAGIPADPDVVLFAIRISVWGRWFIWLVAVFLTSYRPSFWYPEHPEYLVISIVLLVVNGAAHHRVRTSRPITWRWLLFLSFMDVALTTYGVAINGGFSSFIFVAYYPAVAVVPVVFSSLRLSLAWTTITAAIYISVCLATGSVDFAAGNDLALVSRVAVLYILVVGIGLITRFERFRWQRSVARERQMRQDRIEVSQRIHDTIAQTAYMIGLGIHHARQLASDSNDELVAALDATAELTRSAMWEMRGPIDAGQIVEGRELGRVLWSHCATFQRITSVPAEMSQSGTEPPLSAETRDGLFSIAHNALTNAFLHARPGKVQVRLAFEADRITLSISDDGVGLPVDYAERGRGFSGMETDVQRMGGILTVESSKGGGETIITCVVPREANQGGA